jgi:hypothetical protein
MIHTFVRDWLDAIQYLTHARPPEIQLIGTSVMSLIVGYLMYVFCRSQSNFIPDYSAHPFSR